MRPFSRQWNSWPDFRLGRGGVSDPEPSDFIQDVERFELPSEEVPDEMGEEPAALVGGLPRQEDLSQPLDRHFAPQKQRADRSERNGDRTGAVGTAGEAHQPAVGGDKPIGRLVSHGGAAEKAPIQHGVVPGELQETELEEAQERLRRGVFLKQTEKGMEELKHLLVLLLFRQELVRQVDQVGGTQRLFQIGADQGKMRDYLR